MREAVIVSTARTPLTKAHRGEFNITPGPTLAAFAVKAAVERSGVDPALIEDAILGCGYPEGTTGPQHRAPGHRARRAADRHRRRHGQPLLRLGPAGHRDGRRAHRRGRRARP
jgi:acetyl-CoA acetyltransferase